MLSLYIVSTLYGFTKNMGHRLNTSLETGSLLQLTCALAIIVTIALAAKTVLVMQHRPRKCRELVET